MLGVVVVLVFGWSLAQPGQYLPLSLSLSVVYLWVSGLCYKSANFHCCQKKSNATQHQHNGRWWWRGSQGVAGTHYFCPRAIFVCASDMHRRNCVRIANCNSLEAPKVTTTTSLLAVWCPACDLLMLLLLMLLQFLLLLRCCRCCRQTEFSSFHYVHSGLRIASKHFSIERRRQQNTRTSESSNQIRGWWKGREQGGEEEEEEKKKDALVWPFWRSFTQKVSFP